MLKPSPNFAIEEKRRRYAVKLLPQEDNSMNSNSTTNNKDNDHDDCTCSNKSVHNKYALYNDNGDESCHFYMMHNDAVKRNSE